MTERSAAEEHLRVIRSLMEKATIYRAISAEAAAVGGVLAILGSFAFGNWWNRAPESFPKETANSWAFMSVWAVVLVLAGGANLLFLYRASARRGQPFVSGGMKMAITSLLPSFIVAGWLTAHLITPIWIVFAVPIWMICYGLGLLATKPFAPRSLMWLGWAFLLAGCAAPFHAYGIAWGTLYQIPAGIDPMVWKSWNSIYTAQGLMAGSFGLFHLVYAACAWPRRSQMKDQDASA